MVVTGLWDEEGTMPTSETLAILEMTKVLSGPDLRTKLERVGVSKQTACCKGTGKGESLRCSVELQALVSMAGNQGRVRRYGRVNQQGQSKSWRTCPSGPAVVLGMHSFATVHSTYRQGLRDTIPVHRRLHLVTIK